MSAKYVCNLGRTIGRVSAKRQKQYCSSLRFPSSFKRLAPKTGTTSSSSSSRPSSSKLLNLYHLAASALVHSLLNTFEVFRLSAFFVLEKGHYLLRFFFEDIFHKKQIDLAWQNNRAIQSKTCCASITLLLMVV